MAYSDECIKVHYLSLLSFADFYLIHLLLFSGKNPLPAWSILEGGSRAHECAIPIRWEVLAGKAGTYPGDREANSQRNCAASQAQSCARPASRARIMACARSATCNLLKMLET